MNNSTNKSLKSISKTKEKIYVIISCILIFIWIFILPALGYYNYFKGWLGLIGVGFHLIGFIFLLLFPCILFIREEPTKSIEKYIIPWYVLFLFLLRFLGIVMFFSGIPILFFAVIYRINERINWLIPAELVSGSTVTIAILGIIIAIKSMNWMTSPIREWIAKNVMCPLCKDKFNEIFFFIQYLAFLAFKVNCKKCKEIFELKTGKFDKTLRFYKIKSSRS